MVARSQQKTQQYWYPCVIFNYKVVKDDCEYGLVHHYSVRFDEDNDEVHSIEDACVFLQEDHLLSTSSPDKRDGRTGWIGVKNVIVQNSNDLWAGLLGGMRHLLVSVTCPHILFLLNVTNVS